MLARYGQYFVAACVLNWVIASNVCAAIIEYDSRIHGSVSPYEIEVQENVVVGVKPFVVANPNAAAASFESIYFPSELIQVFLGSMVEAAVFVTDATPAVDFVISGTVDYSTRNRAASITVQDSLKREVLSMRFSRMDWHAIAAQILKAISVVQRPLELEKQNRIAFYTGQAHSTSDPAKEEIINLARNLEREKILQPVTDLILQYAKKNVAAYNEWRNELSELESAQKRQERKEREAEFNLFLGGVRGVGAAISGNQSAVLQAQSEILNQGRLATEAQQNQASIRQATEEMSQVYETKLQPRNVTFMNHVYKLSGNFSTQIAAFRGLVKRALIDSPENRTQETGTEKPLAPAVSPALTRSNPSSAPTFDLKQFLSKPGAYRDQSLREAPDLEAKSGTPSAGPPRTQHQQTFEEQLHAAEAKIFGERK